MSRKPRGAARQGKQDPRAAAVAELLSVVLDDGGEPDQLTAKARAIVTGAVDIAGMGWVEAMQWVSAGESDEARAARCEQYRVDTLLQWHHHWSYQGPDVAAEAAARQDAWSKRHGALMDAISVMCEVKG